MESKSLVIMMMLSCCVAAISGAATPTQCTYLRDVMTGANVFRRLMANYYNTRANLEDPNGEWGIHANLFENLEVMGAFNIYSNALKVLSSKNLSYFDGLDYSGLFSAMMTQSMTDICNWLLSYGDSLTYRTIDCNNEEELTLLATYLQAYPLVDRFRAYFFEFGCANTPIYAEGPWLSNINSTYYNEISSLVS